jgi:hypothetical protein
MNVRGKILYILVGIAIGVMALVFTSANTNLGKYQMQSEGRAIYIFDTNTGNIRILEMEPDPVERGLKRPKIITYIDIENKTYTSELFEKK